jgi:aquaporin Z
LLAAIFAVGHVSGGRFNPAVTVAMVLDKRTLPVDAAGYIVAQAIGAIGAAALVMVVAGQASVAAGVTKPGGGVTDIGALILEVVLTAGFVAVILTSTKRAHLLAPLVIPLTLVAIHFAAAPLTGASVNPVRSLGSALVGGDLAGLWIYIVAPLVGAVLGWAVFRAIDGGEEVVVA